MAYINVICGDCGRMLGRESVPVFGIDPDFNGCKDERTDPDCQYCNPFYWEKCSECGSDRINNEGICQKCKNVNVIKEKGDLNGNDYIIGKNYSYS